MNISIYLSEFDAYIMEFYINGMVNVRNFDDRIDNIREDGSASTIYPFKSFYEIYIVIISVS